MKTRQSISKILCNTVSIFILTPLLLTVTNCAYGQNSHPHILVQPGDKPSILDKISTQSWAKKAFDEIEKKLAPYVERHKTDPQWILSRYLMNRQPGKRYTQFFSDEDGTELVKYAGDAPFPTVRVSPHKRPPITKDGYSYKMPSIEELLPNDTSMKMLLKIEAPGGKKELVDPQSFVEGINGRINELVLDASILYWITAKEEYAIFAADILTQWAHGASFQNPIEGPCRTGFLSIQTLGDRNYEAMALAYDFLYDFLRQKNYETSWYEGVFQKIAHTMTFRGFWNNNWFAAQSPALVFAALSLEDKTLRDYYLNFYQDKDTVNGACGHLGIPSVVEKWLTPDGHWKEPGGYHNFPVSNLLISALAMEKNGYPVFEKNPALLKASYVMLKYSFPNFSASTIGDTGPVSQSPDCLEIGIVMAKKYGNALLNQLIAAMDVMIHQKGYKRENSDYLGLLCYLPEIPQNSSTVYSWPRSGELDFAKLYLQRNGTDRQNGLMYVVQGASYNHNHANGMSMELYGKGTIMGVDPGKGLTYEAPMHVNYYAQWAAHNTVVAGSISSSVPYFRGGGGTKQIGHIVLETMEPKAEKEAVSPNCSFTDTRYTDISTKTMQSRTLAIVRTSEKTGYYVDIYRSANPANNEYLYHNIGDDLRFLTTARKPIVVKPAIFPISKEPFDPPGFRCIEDYHSTGKINKGVIALFSLKGAAGQANFMQILFAGENERVFYSGKGPQSGTAEVPYRTVPTPTLVIRQEGEAWNRPFIAIYEPFTGSESYSVEKMELLDSSRKGEFVAIRVFNKDASQQIILQSLHQQRRFKKNDWKFLGNFSVIGFAKNECSYLYLGSGSELSYKQYSLKIKQQDGSANLSIKGNSFTIDCNQETIITLPAAGVKNLTLTDASGEKPLVVVRSKDVVSFTVPAVKDGVINAD